MKLSEYLKEKSMGNVKQEPSIDELEEQIENARRKIILEKQKLKALKKKEEIERILADPGNASTTPKWVYGLIGILILIIIGGGGYFYLKDVSITGSTVMQPQAENTTVTETPKTEVVVYDLDDNVKMDNLTITTTNVIGKNKIGKITGIKFVGVEAEGVYYVVTLEIENSGKKSIKFDPEILVIDEDEREYSVDETAESYYVEDLKVLDLKEEVKPLLLRKGVKIFDVPIAAKGLKLVIKDSTGEIRINLESKGKIKISNGEVKTTTPKESGPQIKVRLTDVVNNPLADNFVINGTTEFNYLYKIENLEKSTLRCNVDEIVNNVLNENHQILKMDALEINQFPEAIKKSEANNFTVSYTAKCHFEGKITETMVENSFTAQFIN
ncbi:DUF4352 domain-containing protein [Candidatus Woesearchaeota archaeon]|nr:DUF4352 domain-containing protein [Candidatus Woesearchaeota archaeon]